MWIMLQCPVDAVGGEGSIIGIVIGTALLQVL
jgi:hypothetical protein